MFTRIYHIYYTIRFEERKLDSFAIYKSTVAGKQIFRKLKNTEDAFTSFKLNISLIDYNIIITIAVVCTA